MKLKTNSTPVEKRKKSVSLKRKKTKLLAEKLFTSQISKLQLLVPPQDTEEKIKHKKEELRNIIKALAHSSINAAKYFNEACEQVIPALYPK